MHNIALGAIICIYIYEDSSIENESKMKIKFFSSK